MLTPEIFEKLLATYPAEKRELARQVYYRFADGDSGEFFTQLFTVLDVYAHYAERVPEAVIAANQSAHANLSRLREEIGLLAQGMDKRNLNIANQVERTDQLCRTTQAKCDETLARFDALLKNIGSQVDTQAVVAGIEQTLKDSIHHDVIQPFVSRSDQLATQVTPTLAEIRAAAAEASRLWPHHIWKTTLTASLGAALSLTLLATVAIYAGFEHHFEQGVAAKILAGEQVINGNQAAFRQLAIAGVTVQVARSGAYGVVDPSRFALIVPDVDGVEIRPEGSHTNGYVFFTSSRTERQIQQLQRQAQRLSDAIPDPAAGTQTNGRAIKPYGQDRP